MYVYGEKYGKIHIGFLILFTEKRIGRTEQTKKPRIYDMIQFMHLYKLICVFYIYIDR